VARANRTRLSAVEAKQRGTAPVEKALKFQRPLADKLLKVVATGEKKGAA
jgi:hypothetical protein